MDTNDLTAFKKHIRVYIGVFIALLIATVLTVAISYVHFGHAGNITVALIIALAKAGLVAGFFMHLFSEKKSVYKILAATGVFVIGLMALILFSFANPPELSFSTQQAPPVTETHAH